MNRFILLTVSSQVFFVFPRIDSGLEGPSYQDPPGVSKIPMGRDERQKMPTFGENLW